MGNVSNRRDRAESPTSPESEADHGDHVAIPAMTCGLNRRLRHRHIREPAKVRQIAEFVLAGGLGFIVARIGHESIPGVGRKGQRRVEKELLSQILLYRLQ